MFEFFLKNLPKPLTGEPVKRVQPCKCCGSEDGLKISVVDYWDIRTSDIVQCVNCRTSQLDPMLTEEETDKGCLAYYIEESLRTSKEQQEKNLLRNFRRGIHFAYSLKKKNFKPREILELGPGSGYFLAGIKFVFPEVQISVLDVNEEILAFNRAQHGYPGYKTIPEHFISDLEDKFDLVIARDIIEHVTDIDAVFRNVFRYLKPKGLFHFITPNGHEDVWRFFIRYNPGHEHSELLINHVNYFDGKGLDDHLLRTGFSELEYYTYKLKTTFRGRGRKIKEKLKAPVSKKLSSDYYISEKIREVREISFEKNEVLNKWYLKSGRRLFARIICWYKHSEWIQVDPRINVGHEIYGVYQKKS